MISCIYINKYQFNRILYEAKRAETRIKLYIYIYISTQLFLQNKEYSHPL